MKIEQSTVVMNSSHRFSSDNEFTIDSSRSFRTVFAGVDQAQTLSASGDSDRKEQLLLLIEELLTRMLAALSQAAPLGDLLKSAPAAGLPEQRTSAARASIETTWRSEFTETISEHESTDFSSTGKILTADGRALDFTLDLSRCRDFSRVRTTVDGGTATLRDPLVINFGGQAAELAGQCFAFDLDGDGKTETVHELGAASGYLAIDRNGDGRVDDGSELIGTSSGNGFADLAALDGDGNGWLDEADAAFATLRVWQRDAAGPDHLTGLAERGVGALYLGSVDTPFSLKDSDNRLLGQIRASGLYLNEDGSAGSLQQIDLAV